MTILGSHIHNPQYPADAVIGPKRYNRYRRLTEHKYVLDAHPRSDRIRDAHLRVLPHGSISDFAAEDPRGAGTIMCAASIADLKRGLSAS